MTFCLHSAIVKQKSKPFPNSVFLFLHVKRHWNRQFKQEERIHADVQNKHES